MPGFSFESCTSRLARVSRLSKRIRESEQSQWRLTEWLAGAESHSPIPPNNEYIGLGKAWDLAEFLERLRKKGNGK
jgi:hypothetical protein